jgi:hypothetical protein
MMSSHVVRAVLPEAMHNAKNGSQIYFVPRFSFACLCSYFEESNQS